MNQFQTFVENFNKFYEENKTNQEVEEKYKQAIALINGFFQKEFNQLLQETSVSSQLNDISHEVTEYLKKAEKLDVHLGVGKVLSKVNGLARATKIPAFNTLLKETFVTDIPHLVKLFLAQEKYHKLLAIHYHLNH